MNMIVEMPCSSVTSNAQFMRMIWFSIEFHLINSLIQFRGSFFDSFGRLRNCRMQTLLFVQKTAIGVNVCGKSPLITCIRLMKSKHRLSRQLPCLPHHHVWT
ncbi:hypothetical protein D3C73_574990 [compost metagenome]